MPYPRQLFLSLVLIFSGLTGVHAQSQSKIQAPKNRSIADLQALPDDTMKVLYFNRVGWDTAYFNLSLGLEYAEEGLKVAKRINYPLGIILCLNTIGATYNDMGEYDEALAAHMEGLDYAEKYGDPKRTGTALMNMSLVYSSMGDTVQARSTLERAVKIYSDANYEKGLSAALVNLGSLYMRTGYYTDAKNSFAESQRLAHKMDEPIIEAHSWSALGVCFARMKMQDSSDYCIGRAWAMVDSLKDDYTRAQVLSNQIAIELYRDQNKEAIRDMHLALSMFQQIGVREEVVDLYSNLAEIYNRENVADSALVYFKHYMLLRDSLVNEDVMKHQRNLEARHESEQTLQEIELLNKQGDTKKWFLVAVIVVFLMLILLVFVMFQRNRLRKKTNQVTADQNAKINEQNRNITDSISYASRIQEAVVPSLDQLKRHFSDAFVLSKPKDIVSGDFWWCSEQDGTFFLAGADSTGHGVPGGFMSMLGSVFLFEIITERKITSPAEILNQLRDKVISALKRSGSQASGLKDGMDMVMCAFSNDKKKLEFACAMNPLWVIRKNQIIEYRADKFPVGEYVDEIRPFTLMRHECEPGDMIYLFSDGYADQFGGPDGKKLKYKQLRDILVEVANLPCAEQQRILDQRFRNWQGLHEQVDDVLVIGIRI